MERIDQVLNMVDQQLSLATKQGGREEGETINLTGKYCPWSQSEYLCRIASYHWSWASRPKPSDVITCSRYGWHGIDVDVIECTICKNKLILPWQEDMTGEAIRIISQEYGVKIMTSGHESFCPWRARPCEEAISKAKYSTPNGERELLLKRYNLFNGTHVNTPAREIVTDEMIKLARPGVDNVDRGIYGLALTQWYFEAEKHCLSCRFGCAQIPVSDDIFHPIENHSWYCPFIISNGFDEFLHIFESLSTMANGQNDYYPLLSRFTSEEIQKVLLL